MEIRSEQTARKSGAWSIHPRLNLGQSNSTLFTIRRVVLFRLAQDSELFFLPSAARAP